MIQIKCKTGYSLPLKDFRLYSGKLKKHSMLEIERVVDSIINDGKGGNYIFYDWHNKRYLNQCLYNLQEKYDCGGIPDDEWKRITDNFEVYIK